MLERAATECAEALIGSAERLPIRPGVHHYAVASCRALLVTAALEALPQVSQWLAAR
jgi:hypothetical protein